MMTIIWICIAVVVVVIAVLSFILNEQEKKELKNELKRTQNQANAAEEVIKNYGDAQRENEELVQRANAGNSNDSADASVELLHNIAKKGKDRNSKN